MRSKCLCRHSNSDLITHLGKLGIGKQSWMDCFFLSLKFFCLWSYFFTRRKGLLIFLNKKLLHFHFRSCVITAREWAVFFVDKFSCLVGRNFPRRTHFWSSLCKEKKTSSNYTERYVCIYVYVLSPPLFTPGRGFQVRILKTI